MGRQRREDAKRDQSAVLVHGDFKQVASGYEQLKLR